MKRYLLLISLLFFSFGIALSQDSEFQEGEKYYEEKNYEKAILIFKDIFYGGEWGELPAKSALRLGQCYWALQNYEKARFFFGVATRWEGNLAGEAKIGIAVSYISEKKYDQAINILSEVISQYKTDRILAYAYYNRASAYKEKNWIGKALNDFVMAKGKAKDEEKLSQAIGKEIEECRFLYEEFKNKESEYLGKIQSVQGMGDLDGCASLLRELARFCEDWGETERAIDYEMQAMDYSSSEEFKAGSWMNIAWRYFKLKDYEMAANAFKKVIDMYSLTTYAKEAFHRLGDMYGYLGKQDEALKVYLSFIEKYPAAEDIPSIKMQIGWIHYNKGDCLKAAETFIEVAKDYPRGSEAPSALLEAGKSYNQAKLKGKALKAYEEFVSRYPTHKRVPETLLNIAWLYRAIGEREKELEVLKELGELFPQTEYGCFALGLYWEERGVAEEAIEPNKKAAEFYGSLRPLALLNLGGRYHDIGKYDLAIQTFNQLLREYGEGLEREIRREAMLYLGKCFEHKLDYLSAIEYYSLLLKELSSKETLYQSTKVRVGYCYLQLGKYEKAIQTWEELLREIPPTPSHILPRFRGNLNWLQETYRNIPLASLPCQKINKREIKLIGPIYSLHFEFKMDLNSRNVLVIYGRLKDESTSMLNFADTAYEWKWRIQDSFGCILPLREDTTISPKELQDNNLVIFGNPRTSRLLESITAYLPIKIRADRIEVADRVYRGNDLGVIMLAPNPYNEEKFVLLYTASDPELLFEMLSTYHGLTDYIVFRKGEGENHSVTTLEAGYFLKNAAQKAILSK